MKKLKLIVKILKSKKNLIFLGSLLFCNLSFFSTQGCTICQNSRSGSPDAMAPMTPVTSTAPTNDSDTGDTATTRATHSAEHTTTSLRTIKSSRWRQCVWVAECSCGVQNAELSETRGILGWLFNHKPRQSKKNFEQHHESHGCVIFTHHFPTFQNITKHSRGIFSTTETLPSRI